jgi:toxin ParE1/3/4
MSLPVVYRRQVGRDLAAGLGYYEDQTRGLGERFLTAVGSALDAIERYPQMFAQVHGEVRRALLSQFPYGVFYRVESKRVVVLAVLHTARDSRIWPQPRRSVR